MIDPIFDVLPDGVCVSDERGAVLYMNAAAERLLDRSLAAMAGKTLCEVLCERLDADGRHNCGEECPLRGPDAQPGAVNFAGKYKTDPTYSWHGVTVQKRERFKHLRVRCLKTPYSFPGPGERRNVTLIEDATGQHDLERHREDWRSMVAHDLRAPLTSIFATLRLIQEDEREGKKRPPDPALIEASVRSTKKILELLDLYLDVAKLDAGLMPVNVEPIELAEVVRTCSAEQKALADSKSIAVSMEVPAGVRAAADRGLLERIVQNVLNNALKFTPAKGKVTIKASVDGGDALLSIRDTGSGIAAEDLPLIFDRFHQAKARRAGRLQGTGLGLAFCREAAAAMKGDISIASSNASGTEFLIRLPAAH